MDEIELIKERIKVLEERNKRVEQDKKWEGSYMRRVLLFAFTYIAIGLYMMVIAVPRSWLNAIVPSVGFLLSTLTLPFFKKWWMKRVK